MILNHHYLQMLLHALNLLSGLEICALILMLHAHPILLRSYGRLNVGMLQACSEFSTSRRA